jgi:predicted transcriptional regulator
MSAAHKGGNIMSQVQKSIIAQPLGAQRKLSRRAKGIVAAAVTLAATGIATILLLTSLNSAPTVEGPAGGERPTVVVPADAYQYPH